MLIIYHNKHFYFNMLIYFYPEKLDNLRSEVYLGQSVIFRYLGMGI